MVPERRLRNVRSVKIADALGAAAVESLFILRAPRSEKLYTILDRNDATALLVTYEQRSRGHLLVISIRQCETILELDREEPAAVMSDIVRATAATVGAFDPEGVAVWQNNASPPFPRRWHASRWRHGVRRRAQAHSRPDRRDRRPTPAAPMTLRQQHRLIVTP